VGGIVLGMAIPGDGILVAVCVGCGVMVAVAAIAGVWVRKPYVEVALPCSIEEQAVNKNRCIRKIMNLRILLHFQLIIFLCIESSEYSFFEASDHDDYTLNIIHVSEIASRTLATCT